MKGRQCIGIVEYEGRLWMGWQAEAGDVRLKNPLPKTLIDPKVMERYAQGIMRH